MSGETTSSATSAPPSSEPDRPSQAEGGGDAALIVAALGRMEAAARGERQSLGRLRTLLGDMAQAIAKAKAVADSEIAAAMLDEFEHRVDAMIEVATGAPALQAAIAEPAPEQAAEEAPEADQVPTVSGVVLQLGDEPAQPPAVEDLPKPEAVADRAPTVAMLTAMVEALSASIQMPVPAREEGTAGPDASIAEAVPAIETPATAEAAIPAVTLQETDLPASFEQQMENRPARATEEPPAGPDASIAEAVPAIETPATAEAAIPPVTLQETDLLASFEPMETRPAIEEPQAGSDASIAEAVPAIETPATAEAATPAVKLQETDLLASFEQMETRPFPPPEEGTAVIFAPKQEPEPEPEPPAAPELPATPEPEQAVTPPPGPAAAMAEPAAEADFDPEDFLFGPEPEPDPAAFLLDPAPPPIAPKTAISPQPEFAAMPPAVEHQPAPATAPHDPLHALNAMSEAEKIALFT